MTVTQTPDDLTATTTIAASPAQVWAMVTDVARMSSWSPQVVRTVVVGRPVRLGTRFVNINHQGWKHWPTTAKVVRFTPHSDFAFRIAENHSVWSYRLEPTDDGGTLVTHRRELPDGISLLSRGLTKVALGGQDCFAAELREGMERTLERLKAEAER
ncbi:SRPBCC family protein [Nocardioides sp. KR10-350]|uniref:SRPBCC family protein n=1 Tax=Nocardioides cheoyonin TaxID=3156615 RepID=UPI0032B32739